MKLWMTSTNDIWHSSEPTNSEDTESNPCLVVNGNALICLYRSMDERLLYMEKRANETWSSPLNLADLTNHVFGVTAAVFKGVLYVAVHPSTSQVKLFTYKDGNFSSSDALQPPLQLTGITRLVVYEGKLYLFGHHVGHRQVTYCSTTDGCSWSGLSFVNYGDKHITIQGAPSVVSYKGILYLLFKVNNVYNWMTYDGIGWSSPVTLTVIDYAYDPAVVVHNGLLKAFFTGKPTDDGSIDARIHQYSFDGNCWSDPIPSPIPVTTRALGVANFEGKLYSLYLHILT